MQTGSLRTFGGRCSPIRNGWPILPTGRSRKSISKPGTNGWSIGRNVSAGLCRILISLTPRSRVGGCGAPALRLAAAGAKARDRGCRTASSFPTVGRSRPQSIVPAALSAHCAAGEFRGEIQCGEISENVQHHRCCRPRFLFNR
jgi:hypothetical protein